MKKQFNFLSVVILVLVTLASCSKNPKACCAIPGFGYVGKVISFNGSCSTNSSKYKWDFGDGSTSKDASTTHAYATTGIFTVKFMAMNSDESKMSEFVSTIDIKQ